MTFPKKGTRRIVVSGDTYHWMNPMPPNPTDLHSLAVGSPEHPGRYLAVQFALPQEHTGLGFAITPAIVADVISAATALGWPEVDKPWHRTWRNGQLQGDRGGAAQQGVAADDVLPRFARSEHRP